jgi:uncharacterized cupin superfamily protein
MGRIGGTKINLRNCELDAVDGAPAGRTFRARSLSNATGAKATGCGVYELDPGQASWPYHFELAEEEWLFVVFGEVSVRTPDGERRLRAGDVVCFPVGAAGAHAVSNPSNDVARFAIISAGYLKGGGAVYPDEGKFLLYTEGFHHRGRLGDMVDYWDGV